jgi:hypothetical protein
MQTVGAFAGFERAMIRERARMSCRTLPDERYIGVLAMENT